jgi:PAS domain S-box-containing protein
MAQGTARQGKAWGKASRGRAMLYDNLEGLAQALFEESGDALFLFDPDTEHLLDANAMAQRLTGFCVRDLLRIPMAQLLHFGGASGLQRLRQATSKSSTFHSQEGYFLCTTNPEVWIPINLTVSRLHVKPRTLALLTARDVREQRQTHAQLKQVEEELRRILRSIPDCLWSGELKDSGHILYRYISPVVAEITGQPPDFFLHSMSRWWSVIHSEDRPLWAETIARLRFAVLTQGEYRVVRPDGTVRWVREHIRASHGADKEPVLLDGILRDITEQKMAREQQVATEARFRAFIDDSPAVAFMKDLEGRLVYCNKSFTRTFQALSEELLGKTAFDLFPADLARRLHDNDAAALAATQPLETIEHVPTPDGVLRSWLVFKFPVEATGGRLLGGMGVDLTGRKDLQEFTSEGNWMPRN